MRDDTCPPNAAPPKAPASRPTTVAAVPNALGAARLDADVAKGSAEATTLRRRSLLQVFVLFVEQQLPLVTSRYAREDPAARGDVDDGLVRDPGHHPDIA